MKKYFKTLVTFGLIMIMIVSSLPVYAATNTEIKIDELEVTLEQLEDGITVIISLDKNNNKVQTVVTYDMMGNETISTKIIQEAKEISNSQDLKSVGDGTIEILTFHVGFKDWTNFSGDLYYTIAADESLYKVTGNAYVKNLSYLNPIYYSNVSINDYLFGSFTTSRSLEDGVDTGNDTTVRVGFSNIKVYSTAGEVVSLGSGSSLVSR